MKKFENARNKEEADAFMNDFIKEGQGVLQNMLSEALRRGHDCNYLHDDNQEFSA